MAKKDTQAVSFDDNPLHTGVTKDTASTPGYFRMLLPGLITRYILRWGVESSPEMMEDLHDAGFKKISFGNPEKITTRLQELAVEVAASSENGQERKWSERGREALESEKGRHLLRDLKDEGIWHEDLEKIVGDAAAKVNGSKTAESYGRRWRDFNSTVKSKVTGNSIKRYYDYSLGTGTLFMTGYYANRVASDIKKVFAETVGYELDKDPRDVTYHDIWSSQNELVKEVRHNFIKKNLGRVATDLVFFTGTLAHIPRLGFFKKYSFSDLGVGVKGAQLIGEVLNKQTTIFEDLVQIIDNKMNPLKGLGAPINVGEIFDLYQKYTLMHDPKATFRDALSGQNHDGRDWNQSQAIFRRIGELMNNTYKYKHIGEAASQEPKEPADFALPKFLYLLGNNLIDTYRPDATLAYVEVANRYGIPAVRQLQRALERGIVVEQALVNYPEELRQRVRHIQALGEVVAPSAPATGDAPGTKIYAASERAALRDTTPAYQPGLS